MFDNDLTDLADAIRPTLARVYLTIRRRSPFGEYTAAQGSTLATLAEHGPMRMGELARREGVRMPTVTAAVDVLVGHGLLRRDPDPDDRRAVQVSITDNDLGPTGTIAMNASAYNYREDSTLALVAVTRTGGF